MLFLGSRCNVVARFISGIEVHGLCFLVLQLCILFHKLTTLILNTLMSIDVRFHLTRHGLIGGNAKWPFRKVVLHTRRSGVDKVGCVVKRERDVTRQLHIHFLLIVVVSHDALVRIDVFVHRFIIIGLHEAVTRVMRAWTVSVGVVGKV